MRLTLHALALLLLVVTARRASAQRPDMADESFVKSAMVVMTFDYFAARCERGNGLAGVDAQGIHDWQAENAVDGIRARVSELERDSVQQERVRRARAAVEDNLGKRKVDPCKAAVAVTRLPDAKFATTAPQLVAALRQPKVRQPAVGESEVRSPSAAKPPLSPGVLAQIESFGFDSRAKMGIGGFLTMDTYPVVLFRNGEALIDVVGLNFPGGLDAHKRANPDAWRRWRRDGGKLQLTGKSGWKALPFQTTYPRLPDDFRLDGFFRSLSGAGTLAVGGTQEVTAWSEYRFFADGQVVRGGGAGGRSEAGDASVATSSVAPNRRGRYHVDGLTLHIAYGDGSTEDRILITDPGDPASVIWLDGVGYVRRRR